jgi:hypothetical protein
MSRPPRPECTIEPCPCWHPKTDKCFHKVMEGQQACVLDDEERREMRRVRMERKAKEGK